MKIMLLLLGTILIIIGIIAELRWGVLQGSFLMMLGGFCIGLYVAIPYPEDLKEKSEETEK